MTHAKSILAGAVVALPLFVWGVSSNNPVAARTVAQPADVHAFLAEAQQDLTASMPDAPGKDITIKTCTKCHSITNVTGAHKDMDGWTATITKMVGYGATGSDDDFQAILTYVNTYYGMNPPPAAGAAAHAKIMVNKETAAQLVTDLGLTDAEAASVVDYRTKNGDFKTIDDLKKVPSVDAKKFDAHAADLQF